MHTLCCPAFDPDAPFAHAPTGPASPLAVKPDEMLGETVAVQGEHYLTAYDRDPQGNTYLTCACGRRFHKDEAVRVDAGAATVWAMAVEPRCWGLRWPAFAALGLLLLAVAWFVAWAVRG